YAKPEDVGMASASLDQISEEIKKMVENGDPVGAEFLVIKNRKIIKHETFGWMNKEEKIPVKRNTICRVRSMTKPFIGTAILMLAEEGKLKPDDPISKYLPSFDNEKSGKITIRQMLTHTAGFRQDAYPRSLILCKSLREAVDEVGKHGPPDQPGTMFNYSDKDSSTLGAVVAEISGMPVEDFIQTRLFTPLGMKNSFCNYKETDPRRGNVSCTYRKIPDGFMKYWDTSQPQRLKFFRASGGIYSTPIGYAKFLLMWMNKGQLDSKRYLSEVSVKKALEPSLLSAKGTPGIRQGYGMHWSILKGGKEGYLPRFGHNGSDGTLAAAVPDQDLMVFYFTQSRGGATLGKLSKLIYQLLVK
ncbi:MAG: beta-lactamase family protein, partial [bacterium]|nr:beta-lactamase family protein [bacterium]